MGGGQIQYKLFSILRFRQKLNGNIIFSQEYIYIYEMFFFEVFLKCFVTFKFCERIFTGCQGCIGSETGGQSSNEYLLTKWLKGVPNKISLNLEGFHEILHIFCCMILVRNHYQNSELKRPQCLNKPQVDQDMIHAFSLQSTSQKSCFCWVLFIPVSWGLVRVSHTHDICIYIYYSLYLHICILWSLYPMSNKFFFQQSPQRCLSDPYARVNHFTRKSLKWYLRWVTCHEVLLLQGTMLMQCSERLFGSLVVVFLARPPT